MANNNPYGQDKTLAQKLAFMFGVTFLLVGILGFIPGITSNYDELKFAGENSDAELLGLFQVSILHNIAHMLFGIGSWQPRSTGPRSSTSSTVASPTWCSSSTA